MTWNLRIKKLETKAVDPNDKERVQNKSMDGGIQITHGTSDHTLTSKLYGNQVLRKKSIKDKGK